MTAKEKAEQLQAAVTVALEDLYYSLPRDWPRLSAELLDRQNALAVQFRGAAHYVAKYIRKRFPLVDGEELADECMVGVVRASRKWRPGKGACFATFAYNGAYFAGLAWAGRAVHRGFTGLSHEPGFSPVTVSEVEYGGEFRPIADTLPAPEPDEPPATREELAAVLAGVKPRHRELLQLRLVGGKTLSQCSRVLGISKEGVRQMEVLALRAVRRLAADLTGEVA